MITNYLTKKIVKSRFLKFDFNSNRVFFSILKVFLIYLYFINNSANAQVANYTFSETSGSYTALSSPSTAIAGGWDDNVVLIPIGFNYKFNGSIYSNCVVSTNGYISFSNINPGADNYTPISSTGTYSGAIAAVGVDLQDSGTNPITFLTTGVAPNRVLTVQWSSARRFARSGNFNFQIKLFETTNVVSIVYGACAPTGNSGQNINVQVGLRADTNLDFNNRSLTTDNAVWDANTSAGTSNTAACRTRSSNYPNSGRTFTWTPANCLISSVQPTILSLTPVSGPTITGTFTAPTPRPSNFLVVANTVNTAPTLTNGTNYSIGSILAGGSIVIDNDTNTTFSSTGKGLALSTTYYFFVYSFNGLCNDGPKYNITSPLTGSASTGTISICTPTVTAGFSNTNYISKVSFVGCLNDVSQSSTFATVAPFGYQNYTSNSNKAIQAQGGGVNVDIQAPASSFIKAWIDWNKNGEFNDVGELVYDSAGIATASTTFGFVVPISQITGDYRIRIRINQRDPSGTNLNSTPNFTSCNLIDFPGETEDYLFTVIAKCTTQVTTVFDGSVCGSGTANLSVTGTGSIYKWYSAATGGTLLNTGANFTTPNLTTTTSYFVEVDNCAAQPRIEVIAEVNPIPVLNFTPNAPIVCGENIVLALTAGGDKDEQFLINENFEGATALGVFTNQNLISNATTIDNITNWQKRSSIFVPAQQTWFPAIASGTGTNKFALSTSDVGPYTVENALVSPVLNSNTFLDLTFSFDIYFSRYYPDSTSLTSEYVVVEVSTNGGTTYPNEIARYTTDQGIGTKFSKKTFNLNAYINNPNLRIRIRYYANQWFDGVAIDNVKLYGFVPLTTSFTWSTGVNAYTAATCNPITEVYTNQPLTTVYIKPSAAQLELGTYSFTATAILSNGCTASTPITVTNNSRTWKGLADNNWNNAANWGPAILPTIDNCVIIPAINAVLSGSNVVGYGKNLNVKSTGNLNIQTSNSLVIQDVVTVATGGVLNIENDGSLVQVSNVLNSGNINYNRNATGIRGLDYVYWSSPVAGQNLSSIYSSPVSGPKYFWNTVGSNTNGGLGNWNAATGTMAAGQGYIMRGSSNYYAPAANISALFSGIPNNGTITIKAKRGDMTVATVPSVYTNPALAITNDNWSLLGNPYPSAINGLQFLQTNASNLVGTLYLWRHLNAPALIASPFYGAFTYNYNSSTDYLAVNYTGTTTPGASDIIKTGQAFMVQRLEGTQDLTGVDVTFNNAMRSNSGIPMANNNFFRNTNQDHNNYNINAIERNRIWLDVINNSTLTSETALVGYIQNATNSVDNLFDAPFGFSNATQIYSIQDNQKLIIQGRALPFNENDRVNLGLNVLADGNYRIAINTIDGLFENQNIYLEDQLTGIIHDLKMAPYSFESAAGNFEDRFILKYINASLASTDFEVNNDFKIATSSKLTLTSSNQNIKKVEIFDLLGRKIDEYKNLNTRNQVLENLLKSNKVYIIKTTFENDLVITKKVMF